MATNDLVPLFFSDRTEQPDELGTAKAWDIAAISSRLLKTSFLAVTASAILFAVLLGEIHSSSLRMPQLPWSAPRRLRAAPLSQCK
jgi:hypothetical protein